MAVIRQLTRLIKDNNSWSQNHTIFQTPLDIKAGNKIDFRSKTSNNSSVTHAIVNIMIEIDI